MLLAFVPAQTGDVFLCQCERANPISVLWVAPDSIRSIVVQALDNRVTVKACRKLCCV